MTQITLQANHCWIDAFNFNPQMLNIPYGIYILGVKSNQEGGTRVLPFYVGETNKNVLKYLRERRIPEITSKNTKWTIFSEDFLRNKRGTTHDFILRYFSPKQKKVPQYPSCHFGNDILYYNDQSFFLNSKIMGRQVPSRTPGRKDWPLALLNNPISQTVFNQATLDQNNVFMTKDSFFFTVIEVFSNNHDFQTNNSLRKTIEAYIKFSLKINVISHSSISCKTLEKFLGDCKINLKIVCPDIEREFHTLGSCPTDQSTILFP